MATDLRQKHVEIEADIQETFDRAAQRIRFLDLTAGVLALLAFTLAYACLMVVGDRFLTLRNSSRQLALVIYFVGSAALLYWLIVRPLRRAVNPRYVARLLERTIPGARNSLLNWVDLHGQKLPLVFRHALGRKAAGDLDRTDADQVVRNPWVLTSAIANGVFFVLFVALFLTLGAGPFFSILGRAFAPFGSSAIPTRTHIELLRPAGGHATVTVGDAALIVVRLTGRVPRSRDRDAARVLIRSSENEPYRERSLTEDESGKEWSTSIDPIDVGTGFLYRVTAGDAATDEYRIRARPAPGILTFQVTYRPPAYTARPVTTSTARRLEGLRGTVATLTVQTNRTLSEGRIEFTPADGATRSVDRRGEIVNGPTGEPDTIRLDLPLERSGKYRIHFRSTEGEDYADSAAQELVVLDDPAPTVSITEPLTDVTAQAGGLVKIVGTAHDEIGVQSITLRARVIDGPTLRPQPYRSKALPHGGYPSTLNYLHFLELGELKSEGRKFDLRPGSEIELWLEARDACDIGPAQVGESQHRRVKIGGNTQSSKEAAKQRQQAEQEKKQHEAAQDGARQKEDQSREQQRNGGGGGQGNEQQDRDTGNTASEIQKALDQRDKDKGGSGSGQPKNEQGKGQNNPGEKKNPGSQDAKNPDSDQKGEGKEGGSDAGMKSGEGKEGQDSKNGEGAGKPKDGPGKSEGNGKPGESKGAPGKGNEGQANTPQPRHGTNGQPGSPGGTPPEKATPQDASGLGQQLRSNNQETRAEAKRKLEQIKNGANDPKAREEAEHQLSQAGTPDATDKKDPKSDISDPAKTARGDPLKYRASMLQLEEFRKKVDQNILRDLKMSQGDFEKFLKEYAAMARRQQAARPPETLPASGATPGTLPSIGGHTLTPTGDLQEGSDGRPAPPADYRDAYSKFLRRTTGTDR
jgi:hypothetical protein